MKAIYEPRGKAAEYSELACNLFTGCAHRCKYCYCPAIMHTTLDAWADTARPRKGILEAFEKDAVKFANDPREILFCFMCDPYQSEGAAWYTGEALKLCERYNLKAQVLTKNPERALKHLEIIKRNGWKIGSTIIFSHDATREEWEPGAPTIKSRCEAINAFHDAGVYTWISVEPVIIPEQALEVICKMRTHVNFWKVGRWNHDKRANEIDWEKFLVDAESALSGARFYIKHDLEKYRGLKQNGKTNA